ncbi:AMP-binding protein [Streptomyces sp. NPDC127079]|uniref:AMP-binding protein n=1 Tax=Streptomyces sp. NPDC127079 TaxID=3347132 RepID=UPI0036597A24
MTTARSRRGATQPEDADTILRGPSSPSTYPSLEEIVRPYDAKGYGLTVSDGASTIRLSYPDLMARTAATAVRLREAGVTPGTYVACTVSNDLSSVLTALGTWMAGGCLVSVPPMSRDAQGLYAARFTPVLARMGCDLYVSDTDAGQLPIPPGARLVSQSALTAPAEDRHAVPQFAIQDAALVQFTSGSMGTPKGVVISREQLASQIQAGIAGMELEQGRDRIVSWLPLYHDMGLVAMFLYGLAARIDVVLMPPASFATRPASWLTALSRERATVSAAPNFAYRLAAAVPYEEGLDLSRMRASLSGGERIHWQTLSDFHRTAGPLGFPWEAIQPCYGLAESVVGTTSSPLGRGPVLGPGGHVSLGVPASGIQLRLRTGLEPTAIHLAGESRFSGYQTADGFVPSSGDWHDTSDSGFTHDGELFVLGRRNEVISLAGHNVFAEDAEAVAQNVGGRQVRSCAAFRDPADEDRFAMFVEVDRTLVRAPDSAADLARDIRSSVSHAIGTRLTSVTVVRPGSIPRTTSGKVQRSQCRDLAGNEGFGRRVITELR